jgi:hypothetical protein
MEGENWLGEESACLASTPRPCIRAGGVHAGIFTLTDYL